MSIARSRRHLLARRSVRTPIEQPGSKPESKVLLPRARIISVYRFNAYELEENLHGSALARYFSSKNSLDMVLIAIDDKRFERAPRGSKQDFRQYR